ncbi:hypothetical protein [Methylobacterium radiotolerans]|uniref:hypothetical protein n=1 Tax=Methylobacterium radiotolerans TaxID=31998 RepID=UPI0038D01E31
MRIEVRFVACGTAKLPGQRKFHEVRIPAATWVDVAEAASNDAPVALSITRASGPALEIRNRDGGLLRPYERAYGRAPKSSGPMVSASDLVGTAASGTGPFNPLIVGVGQLAPLGLKPAQWDRRPLLDEAQAAAAEIGSSTEEEARAIIHRNAASLVLVEGQVWIATVEPVYVVGYASPEDYQAGIRSAWIEIDEVGGGRREIGKHFRADHLADALLAVAPDGDWDPDDPSTFGDRVRNVATVRDASVLRYGYDQYPALHAGLKQLVQIAGAKLATFTSPTIMEWTRTRDLIQAKAPGGAISGAADRLAVALQDEFEPGLAASIRRETELWRLSPIAQNADAFEGPRP